MQALRRLCHSKYVPILKQFDRQKHFRQVAEFLKPKYERLYLIYSQCLFIEQFNCYWQLIMHSADGCFRLKLEFESPPPGMPGSCKYMILVKKDICKTIYDLEQLAIRKFGFSKGATITLSLDGFVLVSTEEISVLANNDCVSVTVQRDTRPKIIESKNTPSKKRRLDSSLTQQTTSKVTKTEKKQNGGLNKATKPRSSITKSKSTLVHSRNAGPVPGNRKRKAATSSESSDGCSTEDDKRPQKQQGSKKLRNGSAKNVIKTPINEKPKAIAPKLLQANSKPSPPTSSEESSSSSEDSENDSAKPQVSEVQRSSAVTINATLIKSTIGPETPLAKQESTTKASNKCQTVKKHNSKPSPPTSSEDSSSSSGDSENDSAKPRGSEVRRRSAVTINATHIKPNIGPKTPLAKHESTTKASNKSQTVKKHTKNLSANRITFNSSSSDLSSSESEMETETHSPARKIQKKEPEPPESLNAWLNSSTINRGFQPHHNNFKDPGTSTNISTVYENPKVTEDTSEIEKPTKPSRNYPELLPSTWPPRVDDVVAYKLLEMSQDYTPVISNYKEAKVLEIFPSATSPIGVNAVKMELLWPEQESSTREGGRFEMDFDEDDSPDDAKNLVLEWQSLLEPKRVY